MCPFDFGCPQPCWAQDLVAKSWLAGQPARGQDLQSHELGWLRSTGGPVEMNDHSIALQNLFEKPLGDIVRDLAKTGRPSFDSPAAAKWSIVIWSDQMWTVIFQVVKLWNRFLLITSALNRHFPMWKMPGLYLSTRQQKMHGDMKAWEGSKPLQ